jgi:hypothetical protein
MVDTAVFFPFQQNMNDRADRGPFAPEILGDRPVRSERPFVESGSSYRIDLAGKLVGPRGVGRLSGGTDRTCGTGRLDAGPRIGHRGRIAAPRTQITIACHAVPHEARGLCRDWTYGGA